MTPEQSSPSNPRLDAFLTTAETRVVRNVEDVLTDHILRTTLEQRRAQQQQAHGINKWLRLAAAQTALWGAENTSVRLPALRHFLVSLSIRLTPVPRVARQEMLEWLDFAWDQALRGEQPVAIWEYLKTPQHKRPRRARKSRKS